MNVFCVISSQEFSDRIGVNVRSCRLLDPCMVLGTVLQRFKDESIYNKERQLNWMYGFVLLSAKTSFDVSYCVIAEKLVLRLPGI